MSHTNATQIRVSRRKRAAKPARMRIGRVSYYQHHGSWYVYYRDSNRPVRRRVGETQGQAESVAAQVNAQLVAGAPTLLEFTPVTVEELRRRFLAYHETVLRSSLATIRRYEAATRHLLNYVTSTRSVSRAHELRPEGFAAYLRTLVVSPNGHQNTPQRPLRDKGLRFILETCRAMYSYAERMRHLPPYVRNPFSELRLDRLKVEDPKPVFVFDASTELAFFQAADRWAFPIHFILAKTGMRPGELVHLLVEDLDLETGWVHVRNKPELGWRIKTRRDRMIPLSLEAVGVLRKVLGSRGSGPVICRRRFTGTESPAVVGTRSDLAAEYQRRLTAESSRTGLAISRTEQARIARRLWVDAGATDAEQIRASFIRTAKTIGIDATCPKSWRHTFATLLQDANVDPLIRQLTLGHRHGPSAAGGLGMTAVYTHTRPETQAREIKRALELWPQSLEYGRQWHAGSV